MRPQYQLGQEERKPSRLDFEELVLVEISGAHSNRILIIRGPVNGEVLETLSHMMLDVFLF